MILLQIVMKKITRVMITVLYRNIEKRKRKSPCAGQLVDYGYANALIINTS